MEIATLPDLLRLVAVPALGWAAWRDLRVRRVPNRLWYPLAALGIVLLGWEAVTLGVFGGSSTLQARLFVVQIAISLGLVVPLSYLIWRLGGFGGADAKALMTVAVLLPTFPTYVLQVAGGVYVFPTPGGRTTIGVFSLTVLTNAVLLAAAYPASLAVKNLLAGEWASVALVGKRVDAASIPDRYGSLLETPEGYTRNGLDLDALRMYLRWRGATLAELREAPDRYRDPASLPDEPNEPTDGAIRPDGSIAATDGGEPNEERSVVAGAGAAESVAADASAGTANESPAYEDPWGAEAFLDDVGSAWGTTPADLRAGLDVLTTSDRVWYSPGIPFLVPVFLGLVVGLVYGDLLFTVLAALGLT